MQTGRSVSLMVFLGLISTKRTAFSRHFQVKMYRSGWTFHVARTLWSSLGSTRCAVNQTRVRTEIFVALCLPKRVRGRFRVLIRLRSTYYDFATTDYRVSHFVQLTGCCLNGGSVQPSKSLTFWSFPNVLDLFDHSIWAIFHSGILGI